MGRDGKNVIAFGKRPVAARPGPESVPRAEERLVWRQKVKLVTAVKSGVLSLDEVCRRYAVPAEDVQAWEKAIFGPSQNSGRAAKRKFFRVIGKDSA